MGRVDTGVVDTGVKDVVVGGDLDELDELELAGDDTELYPGMMAKNSRRKLEDRIDDLRLQHQLRDYDFKIR
jgi:hypothetical protein